MHDVATVLRGLRKSSFSCINPIWVCGIAGGKETVNPGCGYTNANADEKLVLQVLACGWIAEDRGCFARLTGKEDYIGQCNSFGIGVSPNADNG